MKKEDLLAIAQEAAKNIKSEHDLNESTQMLSSVNIEAVLNANLDNHLGYGKHEVIDSIMAVMAISAILSRPKMVSLKLIHVVIETAISNLNTSRKTNVESPLYKIKSCVFIRRGYQYEK